MDCSKVNLKLSGWLDQELSQLEARLVQEHLDHCPDCKQTLRLLQGVGNKLGSLKVLSVAEAPPDLLAGLKRMPTWWVTLALLRRRLALGAAVLVVGMAGSVLLNLSHPLTGRLTIAGSSELRQLVPGTTLTAKTGQTVTLTLGDQETGSLKEATFQLQGPGALVIHRATESRFRRNQRLDLELPSGTLWLKFTTDAPPHLLNLTTPQALIRLTSTQLLVQATPVMTLVKLFEGKVQVFNLTTGEVRTISSSQMVQVQAGRLTVSQIPAEEWLRGAGKGLPEIPLSPKGPPDPFIEEETEISETPLWYEVK